MTTLSRVLIVSAALWALAGITAGTWRTTQEIAPVAAAEPAELVLEKTDRLPLAPQGAIEDRWLVPPPVAAVQPGAVVRSDGPQTVGTTASVRRPHPPVDKVCGAKGRRWFTRHHWRYWRCRR